jgi:cyclic pyranopterin phosphate synthase
MTVKLPAAQATAFLDRMDRPLSSLRVSVVDRCDLRCTYCMPEDDYAWLPKKDILSLDEVATLVDAFAESGVVKVRLTGGEPLLRKGLTELVRHLARNPRIEDLALTTNATQLARFSAPLCAAGLQRVTVSLDSLVPDRFAKLTRRPVLDQVLSGIRAAASENFEELKINTVVMKGFNDDELVDLIEFGREVGAEVRFIEYMDVGGATQWTKEKVVSRMDILAHLEDHYGRVIVEDDQGSAPAQRFVLANGTRFGIVASVTKPFCSACDRSRLTADGMWYLCLYGQDGMALKEILRSGGSRDELVAAIQYGWEQRADRGAEERLATPSRGVFYQVEELKLDPHREMHTRGG